MLNYAEKKMKLALMPQKNPNLQVFVEKQVHCN